MFQKFTSSTLLQVVGLLIFILFSGECHQEDCSAVNVSSELMQEDDSYFTSYSNEQEMANEFAAEMKASGNRDFALNSDSTSNRRRTLTGIDISVPIIKIPIVFHVLHEIEAEKLSLEQINSQIKVLNQDFRGKSIEINTTMDEMWRNRVADTRIEFELAEIIYIDWNLSDYNCSDYGKLSEYGGSDGWDPFYYLNVWLCNLRRDSGGIIGYAYFPCLLDGPNEWRDGVMQDINFIGSELDDINNNFLLDNSDRDRRGRVLVHEIGHWLNLRHVWGNGSPTSTTGCNRDDLADDTPLQMMAIRGCPNETRIESLNTCEQIDDEFNTDLRDMYENHMDYTDGYCRFMFTEGQAWRMRATLSSRGCRSEMYYEYGYYDCANADYGLCDNQPCATHETGPCVEYNHGAGCSQCEFGYWKIDSDHKCLSCPDIFGDGCIFCQDGIGCGQCDHQSGYIREYNADCDLWICVQTSSNFVCREKDARNYVDNSGCLLPCDINNPDNACDCQDVCYCQEGQCHDNSGCSQCEDGYFLKGPNYPCIECDRYFGESCVFCQDYIGCGQCAEGCQRIFNQECGLWECDCNDQCVRSINETRTYPEIEIFCCKNGCEILTSQVNDANCDCATCEDEDSYSCNTCRPSRDGCRGNCGRNYQCD